MPLCSLFARECNFAPCARVRCSQQLLFARPCSSACARRPPAAGRSLHTHAALCMHAGCLLQALPCTSVQLRARTLVACSSCSLHKCASLCTAVQLHARTLVACSSCSLHSHAAPCMHTGHVQLLLFAQTRSSLHSGACSSVHTHVACSRLLLAQACTSLHKHAAPCMHTCCLQQLLFAQARSSMHTLIACSMLLLAQAHSSMHTHLLAASGNSLHKHTAPCTRSLPASVTLCTSTQLHAHALVGCIR